MWSDTFLSAKHTEMDVNGKHNARKDTQRHSIPQSAVVKKRARLAPRPRSFWFGAQDSTQRDWDDPLPTAGGLDAESSRRKSWRHSVQSTTSNGSTATLHDSRSQSGHSHISDRFSLRSDRSLSSVLTRFSGSTLSTSFTAPSSSRRSSRGSVLQREKRFSSVRRELYADPFPGVGSDPWPY